MYEDDDDSLHDSGKTFLKVTCLSIKFALSNNEWGRLKFGLSFGC